jgi:hypothetical protein
MKKGISSVLTFLAVEFSSQDLISQVFRSHKIRMKDLEERVLEDFMDP